MLFPYILILGEVQHIMCFTIPFCEFCSNILYLFLNFHSFKWLYKIWIKDPKKLVDGLYFLDSSFKLNVSSILFNRMINPMRSNIIFWYWKSTLLIFFIFILVFCHIKSTFKILIDFFNLTLIYFKDVEKYV